MKRFALLGIIAFAFIFNGCQEDDEAVVNEIEFAKSSLEVKVGEVFSPEVLHSPADLPAPAYEWDTSDEDVITVANGGQLKAVSKGRTDVQVSADDNRLSARFEVVVVPVEVSEISLESENLEMIVGADTTLSFSFEPDTATNPVFVWASDDKDVVTVDDGNIKAVGPGETVVTMATEDGGVTDACSVKVKAMPVSGVSLENDFVEIEMDSSFQLSADVRPSNATNQDLKWSVDDSEVATVNDSGLVTGISAGTTLVTVETEDGGYTATCEIKVPSLAEMYDLLETGESYVANDGLTVTMKSIQKSVSDSYTTYTIRYVLANNTEDKEIDEGTFKLVSLTGAEAEDQYGFFGSLFPGESTAGSYTFKVLNSKEYHVIEYNGEFFSNDLKEGTLKWGVHDL